MAGDVAAAIAAVKSKMGAKYVWGAEGPDTFDCSGLMQWAWAQAGVTLPRTSEQQATYGLPVKRVEDLQPGDLITSHWGRGGPSSHVAMYLGDGKVIHAPAPGKVVTTGTIDANYRSRIDAMRRVPGAKPVTGGGTGTGTTEQVFLGPGLGTWLSEQFGKELGEDIAKWWMDVPDNDGFRTMGVLSGLKGIAEATAKMAGSLLHVGELATWVLKLALPSTWVRIAAGLLGFMLLILGIVFLIRETRGM